MPQRASEVQKSHRERLQDAFEVIHTYTSDGKRLTQRSFRVGGIVVWGIVVIVLCLAGHSLLAAPASAAGIWKLLRQ